MGNENKKKKNPKSLHTRVRDVSCWGVMLRCTLILGRQNQKPKNPKSLHTRVRVKSFWDAETAENENKNPMSLFTPAFNWWLKQVEPLHTPACQQNTVIVLFFPHKPVNPYLVSSVR